MKTEQLFERRYLKVPRLRNTSQVLFARPIIQDLPEPVASVRHPLAEAPLHLTRERMRLHAVKICIAFWMLLLGSAQGGNPELPVVLGETEHFTILAGSAITSAGGDLYGDAGVTSGAGSTIGLDPAQMKDGTIYETVAGGPAGAVVAPVMLTTAFNNLTTAYNDAALRTVPDAIYSAPGELGGLTLPPGLYKFLSVAQLTSGDLTLTGSASDVWIFQVGSSLTVGTYRKVILNGGALAQNVFWQVGASAELDTYCDFKGTIMADQHIILGVGSKLEGRALARIAHVVFDGEIARLPLSPPVGMTNVTLTVISEHGVGDPIAGLPPSGVTYTNAYGTVLTNRISLTEVIGTTQYVNKGWSLMGNMPKIGTTSTMGMIHTNDAVLTWNWSTNYYLFLSAVNGSITNEPVGWKPVSWIYDLYPQPAFGYAFDRWEVNGQSNGIAIPLNVTMDEAKSVVAWFRPLFLDVSSAVSWNVNWVYDPRLGYFIGTLTITNTSTKIISPPIWFEVESTEWHWLRTPTGLDSGTGFNYLDISADVGTLAPGESVSVSSIELMGRRTATGQIMALWADPPEAPRVDTDKLDTDSDGIPNTWEGTFSAVLNEHDPSDALQDGDLDGMTNGDEYIADTDPANFESTFTIRTSQDNRREVVWNGSPERVYTVWETTDLCQPFAVLASGIVGAGEGTTYTDAEDSGEAIGSHFYRVEVDLK